MTNQWPHQAARAATAYQTASIYSESHHIDPTMLHSMHERNLWSVLTAQVWIEMIQWDQ